MKTIEELQSDNARLESACAELKQFISESEMPMHTSFSDADSIAWRKKREYLLTNQAGEQIQAQCAVMREALEYCGCHEHTESPCDESGSHYKDLCEFCKKVDHALSMDCGTELLGRFNTAKDLVQRCVDTGLLRTDETRQLWDEANEFLKL